jgi:hypothetical protein
MLISRLLGAVLLAIGFAVLGGDLLQSIARGGYAVLTLGELWFALDAEGLNFAQAIVQRYLHPLLWDPPIVLLLQLPAAVPPIALGLLLLLAGRKRRLASKIRR